ncbi:Zn-ribbon domain-containing OB-fold protein [Homoserinimonas sp. OAct 916]|uniref:Zn-ribbon domain-containing OB-fold protein n=1 Tax=Homoserinimonas sp. OAct 916 TaxID=2211450 RepID=UPI000DBE0DC1|nr:OB-fold domain-containing protein [Homoserinimonas sp. OAct 916]
MSLPEVPPADDVTTGWWDATREHRLMVQECTQCGHLQHPPRAVCTACSSMDHLELRETAGTGEVDACTVIHRAPRPDVDVPYTVARVRLTEGPLILTRLVDGDQWAIGDQVNVGWTDLPDGRALPVFH